MSLSDYLDDLEDFEDEADRSITSSASTRGELDRLVQEYLARGNRITQLRPGETAQADGYMRNSIKQSVDNRNRRIADRAKARDAQLINYIRNCLDCPGDLDLAEVSHATHASVAKLRKLMREHFMWHEKAAAALAGRRNKPAAVYARRKQLEGR